MYDEELEIRAHERIQAMLPPLSEEELALLEQDIAQDGCRDALVICDEPDNPGAAPIIIDGNNRYAICTRMGLPFRTIRKEFSSWDDIELWVRKNQGARRNLTPEQLSYNRGRLYRLELAKSQRGDRIEDSCAEDKIADQVGAVCGVSGRTIYRDALYADGIDLQPPETRQHILSGRSGISKQTLIAIAVNKTTSDQILNQSTFLPVINALRTVSEHVGNHDPADVAAEFCRNYPTGVRHYQAMIDCHFDKAICFLTQLRETWHAATTQH